MSRRRPLACYDDPLDGDPEPGRLAAAIDDSRSPAPRGMSLPYRVPSDALAIDDSRSPAPRGSGA